MTILVKIVRATFPAAMIVVCSSAYFVYFDVDRPAGETKVSLQPRPDEVQIDKSATSGDRESSAERSSQTRTDKIPAEVVVTLHPPTEPTPPLPTSVEEMPVPELPMPVLRLDEQVAVTTSDVGLANSSPIIPPTSEPVPSLVVPPPVENAVVVDLPSEQQNVVTNTHFESTPVNDYWVGLERARSSTSNQPSGNQGVIINPYHRSGAVNEDIRPVAATIAESAATPSMGVIQQPSFEQPEPMIETRRPDLPTRVDAEVALAPNARPAPIPTPNQTPSTDPITASAPMSPQFQMPPQVWHEVPSPSPRSLPPVSDHVRQRVIEHWEYGGSLARRHAIQLAKQEFFSGLSLLSEHADQHDPATQHTQALREGFLALEEVCDFQASNELRQSDLSIIVHKHETPLIRDGYFSTDNHSQARQAYLLYAKERIRTAVGQQPMAAELLYSLGKLNLATFEHTRSTDNLDMSRATTLFECALHSDPNHEKTCNELAVIQAKSNDWATAKHLLQKAVGSQPQFLEAWQNLAKVHQRLGEPELASLAVAQVEYLSQQDPEERTVRMVSNAEFMATAAAMDGNTEMSLPSTGDVVPSETPSRFGAPANQ
jgi:tetratricopeptide (TPR) repeat protein